MASAQFPTFSCCSQNMVLFIRKYDIICGQYKTPTGMILDLGATGSSIMEGGRASVSAAGHARNLPLRPWQLYFSGIIDRWNLLWQRKSTKSHLGFIMPFFRKFASLTI